MGMIQNVEEGVKLPFLPLLILFVLSGEQGSLTHGSVMDGRFEGFIQTYQGTYYVEPSERYIKDKNASFHSIIYHEDDVGKVLWLKCFTFRCLLARTPLEKRVLISVGLSW